MNSLFKYLPIILLSLIFSVNIKANDASEIELFKKYLQNLNSVAIDFVQTDLNAKQATGKLLISKPYKFRCNYYPPFPILIVGNKNYISFYDYDMEQLSRIKASENIFNFLLLEGEDLIKHFKIELIENDNNRFKIKLLHQETDKISEITFNKKTNQIEELEIIEDENLITINFGKIEKVSKFDEELFIIKNADTYGAPERFNQKEIQKKYNKIQ